MMSRVRAIFWFLLENIPSVATVVIAVYVGVRSQFKGVSQSELLGWILIVLALLGVSELVERLRKLTHIENTSDEIRRLLDEIVKHETHSTRQLGLRDVSHSRDFSRVLELTRSASREISLLGSTLYTTLNLIRSPLIETLIRTNCNLRVLLSAADSPFLKEKEDEEKIPGKNQAEVGASLAILREINDEAKAKGYRGSIEVREYTRITYFSMYMFDHSITVISLYSFGRRSVELPMLEVERSAGAGQVSLLFRMCEEHYQRLWNDVRTTVVLASTQPSQHKKRS